MGEESDGCESVVKGQFLFFSCWRGSKLFVACGGKERVSALQVDCLLSVADGVICGFEM